MVGAEAIFFAICIGLRASTVCAMFVSNFCVRMIRGAWRDFSHGHHVCWVLDKAEGSNKEHFPNPPGHATHGWVG